MGKMWGDEDAVWLFTLKSRGQIGSLKSLLHDFFDVSFCGKHFFLEDEVIDQ